MRRTRIISTLGPASSSRENIKKLLEVGANVFRLNYSHGSPEDKTELYSTIRSLEEEIGRHTCILADLPGPKIRLGTFPGPVMLETGTSVELNIGVRSTDDAFNGTLPVELDGIESQISVGSSILIADGLVG